MDKNQQDLTDCGKKQEEALQESAALVARLRKRVEELELELQTRTTELNEALARAQESDRIKSQFVSNVSHELRTPLANIRLYLSLLARGEEKRQTDYLEFLQRETGRLGGLIEDLLDISRAESDIAFQRELIDLNVLVSRVVEGNQTLAESHKLTVDLRSSHQTPTILANEGQIIQVVNNLLSNAINYTPENGQIIISTYVDRTADRTWACVSVADTGYGISQEEQEHLFERFFRGSSVSQSRTPGTGLGLAIVKEIVDRHGGQVRVKSEEGQGSEFVIHLPAYAVQDALETEEIGAYQAIDREGLPVLSRAVILVVEDAPGMREGICDILEMTGYSVSWASNGREALQLMETLSPDLIVSDIMMPEMDGYSFYEYVRADDRWLLVPFIFLTAKDTRADIRLGKSIGVDDYLTKPFAPEDLLVAVESRLIRAQQLRRASERVSIIEELDSTAQARLRGLTEDWEVSVAAIRQRHAGRFLTAASAVCRRLAEACNIELRQGQSEVGSPFSRPIALRMDISRISVGTRLPQSLPIIVTSTTVLSDSYIQDLCDTIDQETRQAHRFALLLVFNLQADFTLRQILNQKLQVRAYDVVALGLEDLSEIVTAKEPGAVLRKKILQHIDISLVSTFVTTGPTPNDMFFGREPALRQIVQSARDKSFAVIGGRRVGKTSMLSLLHRMRLPTAGFLSVYHDCTRILGSSGFLSAHISDWRPERPSNAPITFNDLLHAPPTDRPVVLLLDESDKLVPADREADWQLFGALRALTNSGHAQVILSGERTLRAALKDPTSPLFNFADEVLLGPLDFRAVEELVTRPMKQLEIELVDEKTMIDRIWTFTSGHPNVVQRLCRRLIERLNEQGARRIALGDLDAVIEDPQFQEIDFLQTYWEAASPLEKIITLMLSQEAKIYRLKKVRQLLPEQVRVRISASAVKDALDRLVDLRSILKRSPNGYEFAVKAFPKRMRLNKLLSGSSQPLSG
jgi:signal transduction histidine kinase/DNA-binding response OmpR family regulator